MSRVIAYLPTPIDAHYLRTLLTGLDATVTVNDDGVLVIECPDVPIIRTPTTHTAIYPPSVTSATDVRATFEYTYPGLKDYDSPEDEVYDEKRCAYCGHDQTAKHNPDVCGRCEVWGCMCPGYDDGDPSKDTFDSKPVQRSVSFPGDNPTETPKVLESDADIPTEPIVMHNYDSEPPVGSVARCFGCGNVYVHKSDGWVDTDDLAWGRPWDKINTSFCGPVKVIYGPGEER